MIDWCLESDTLAPAGLRECHAASSEALDTLVQARA
jgi:hypothetical protein